MSASSFNILHFNDAYEINRTPYFACQFLEKSNESSLKLFSGDILNPSFASAFLKGRQFIPFFKKMSLDACVVGNHELDWGMDILMEITSSASIPWLLCNLINNSTQQILLDFPKYRIKEINGLKIGILGIVDQSWIESTFICTSDYTLLNPIETAKEVAEDLKSQGCDFIIILTHCDTETDMQLLLNDEIKADFILGGHNHIYFSQLHNNKLLLKSGCDFNFFTQINLNKIPEIKFSVLKSDGVLIDDSDSDQKSVIFTIQKFIKNEIQNWNVTLVRNKVDYQGNFDKELKQDLDNSLADILQGSQVPVALFDGSMNLQSKYIRANQTKMGDLATDLIRIILDTDFVIVQSGHIRPEKIFDDNHIFRLVDLMNTFPLYDTFIPSLVTTAQFIGVLEHGVQYLPNARGSYPNISGALVVYDPMKEPLNKIKTNELLIHGHPVDHNRIYTLGTTTWIAQGGDGYTEMADVPKASIFKEISCLEAFRKLLDLPNLNQNRDEFALIKELIDSYSLEELINLKKKSDKNLIIQERITSDLLKVNNYKIETVLKSLNRSAWERILMYRLPVKIAEVEGTFVFVFDVKIENRVRSICE